MGGMIFPLQLRAVRLKRVAHRWLSIRDFCRNTAFVVALLSIALCACRDAVVVSSSMSPTIRSGERVTVDYTAYLKAAPQRWDVIAFVPPQPVNRQWVMRVVALPGETVSFDTGGIAVNGLRLSLPPSITNVTYVSLDHPRFQRVRSSVVSPYVVPANSYFVLGDNSTNSMDSRFWGAVPRTNVLGKVKGK